MSWMTGILVFVIAWWMVFFMLLPVGVRAQNEDGGTPVPGTPESAPQRPHLAKKAAAATLIAALLVALFILAGGHEMLSFRGP